MEVCNCDLNLGLGKQTSLELARRGAFIIMACRDIEKGARAQKQIEEEVPGARLVSQLKIFSSITFQISLYSLNEK